MAAGGRSRSGDCRSKPDTAESPEENDARNAVALRSVQPEDVLPGDIDANRAASWLLSFR
jgi:N12 class adenine-specific DNA methylase